MKPIDITDDYYVEYDESQNKKILNLKLVIILELQNIKTFLLKDILQIGQKKFFLLIKLKIQLLICYVINDVNEEEIIGSFYEKKLQNTNQKKFRIEKVLNRKCDKLESQMSNGKGIIIHLIAGLTKKISYKNEPILFHNLVIV